MSELPVRDVWVEVDLAALRHNFAQLRGFLGQSVRVMAVVKANAYGHGYVRTAQAFVNAGADALGVTRIEEALELREAGISVPILLFAPLQPANIPAAIQANLHMTVCDISQARLVSDAAVGQDRQAYVHIKVDTGMGRLGTLPDRVLELFKDVASLPGVTIAGTYTHFATAGESSLTYAQKQLNVFVNTLAELKQAGFGCGIIHAANSAAIIQLPGSHFDMVRPGTILYGQYPSGYVPRVLDLRETWKLKARVCQIRELPPQTKIGYGCEYVTKGRTRTAVIPIGYADGFTLIPEGAVYRQGMCRLLARKLRPGRSVWIKQKPARVLGRVGMQLTVVDITQIPDVEVGDEVLVPALRIPTSSLIERVYVDSSA